MATNEIWREIGLNMRMLRQASGVSLRQVEAVTGVGRGTLSLAETGKTRPSLALIEFYDMTYSGDGMLMSMYLDAHVLQPPSALSTSPKALVSAVSRSDFREGDAVETVVVAPATGALVPAGEPVEVCWELRNRGRVPWTERSLRRVGAVAGTRILSGGTDIPVPNVEPGGTAHVRSVITAPNTPGTVVAHWRMVHAGHAFCFPLEILHWVLLVVG